MSPPRFFPQSRHFSQTFECENAIIQGISSRRYRPSASSIQTITLYWGQSPYGYNPIDLSEAIYQFHQSIDLPFLEKAFFSLSYSSDCSQNSNILIYLNDEPQPRAELTLACSGDWDAFRQTEWVDLGSIEGGIHKVSIIPKDSLGLVEFDAFTITNSPPPTPPVSELTIEGELPDAYNTGRFMFRGEASMKRVHGLLGSQNSYEYWTSSSYRPGMFVTYNDIEFPLEDKQVYLSVRFSKNSDVEESIEIYLDDEKRPRNSFLPLPTHGWNTFQWSMPIPLGTVSAGTHSITFKMNAQNDGVIDLDKFTLSWD